MKSDAFTIGFFFTMSLIFLRLFDSIWLTFQQSFNGILSTITQDKLSLVSCFSRKSIHHLFFAVCQLFNTLIIVYFYNLFFFSFFFIFYFRPDDAKFFICCLWPRDPFFRLRIPELMKEFNKYLLWFLGLKNWNF